VNTDHGRQQSAYPEEDRRSFAGFHAFVGRNPVPLISCDKMSFHPFGTCAAWSRESPVEQGSHSAETFPIPLKRSLLRINREAVVASLDGEISSRVTRHAPRRVHFLRREIIQRPAGGRHGKNFFGSNLYTQLAQSSVVARILNGHSYLGEHGPPPLYRPHWGVSPISSNTLIQSRSDARCWDSSSLTVI
jgi:hypothetical protein